MGRYNYTDGEKEILKVQKMQERDLSELESSINNTTSEIEDLKKRVLALAKKKGVDLSRIQTNESCDSSLHISKSDIPSWESLTQRADDTISTDVEIEDLLSAKELQYCIEDIERIHNEFAEKTSIFNKKDMSFLVVATALQTLRWVIIQEICGDLGEKINPDERLGHKDKSIKDDINRRNSEFQNVFSDHGHQPSQRGHKSWEQIIFSSAPFDTTVGSPDFGLNLGGPYHRYKTLGHDPILGWLFGTVNFITDTATLSDFSSYIIDRKPTPHFAERIFTPLIFADAFDSIKEDWLRLPAAVFAEYVHLKSDEYTKLGLPIPILETFSESLAGDLYKSQYDSLCLVRDLKIVGRQAGFSILINMLISLVHGLLYDPKKDGERKHYEVRTRKILCISNSLASAGNIVYAAILQDWKKLDVGGILVTLSRLFMDVRFITRIKEEFIKQEMDKVLAKELEDIERYFE